LHIFNHTSLVFLAGRQLACEKTPCLAENLTALSARLLFRDKL